MDFNLPTLYSFSNPLLNRCVGLHRSLLCKVDHALWNKLWTFENLALRFYTLKLSCLFLEQQVALSLRDVEKTRCRFRIFLHL